MAKRQAEINSTLAEIDETVRSHLSNLSETWEELGLTEEVVRSRFSACIAHVNALFAEMAKEDNELMVKMRGKVANLLNQLEIFNLDLDKNESVDVKGLTLIAAKTKLDISLKELKLMHTLRKEERVNLEAQENGLCSQLGRQPEERPAEKCLSDPCMKELKERVSKLKHDKERLLIEFQKTRSDIIDLYNDLEEQPSSVFEQKITDPNTQNFPLDPDSLGKVARLHDELESRVQQITAESAELRLQLANLWDRLEIDPETRACFLENHPGITRSTRLELREEIERCEELKMQNLEKFTLRMRDELIELWDRCHVSDEERENFSLFRSLDFTEELLERHEAEVRRYEVFFEENREIFHLLSRRAELWDRMTQLEIAATDSNRLNNRGGQLLKEEKERSQIRKELPKVEAKIKTLIHSREETNGEPFLLNGRRASIVLNEQWEAKKQQKESDKQVKKMAQQKQLERDAIMGTTMLAGQKRKMVPGTPDMSRKMPRITPAKAATTAGKVSKFARPVTRPTQKRLEMPRSASKTTSTTQVVFSVKIDEHKLVNDSIASTISYTDFSKHLEARATRSSAVPSNVRVHTVRAPLSPINSTTSSHTPNTRAFSKPYLPQSAPAKPPRNLRSAQTPTTRLTTLSAARSATRPTRKTKPLPIIF